MATAGPAALEARRLAGRLADPLLPLPGIEAAAPAAPQTTIAAAVDEATAAYVAGMQDPFALLRQAEAQLAGLMVLATASRQAIAGHPMLALAADAAREAADGVRAIRVPPRGRHHHVHAMAAIETLDLALAAARRCLVRGDEAAIDAVLGPLRAAHRHLLWATGALPGFEVVALSQACCAQHAAATS
jgi:hypothetical protein